MTLLLLFSGSEPITPKPILSPARVTGPRKFGTAQPPIIPAPILSPAAVTGPVAPLDPTTARPISPAPILSPARVVGAWMPVPADPLEPAIPAGPVSVSRAMRVRNAAGTELDVTAAQCRPQVNGVGSGSFTMKQGTPPVMRAKIGFDVATRRQFEGRVTVVADPEVQSAEEAGRLPQVTVEGWLGEFAEAVVLPDFGAQDLTRLGPPTQDTRLFDWTMNGLGVDSPDGVPKPNIVDSVGAWPAWGTDDELVPLPDVWPDPYAKLMWVTDPTRSHHPRGWCHFREPFGIPGSSRIQLWMAAWDYAELWLDGVPVLTCDKPGVAQYLELDVRDDFHLCTIRAYNDSGRAGVLASIIPVGSNGLYEEPLRRSGGGWKALAYPTRSFRLNPGQIMNRLRLEARRRRVANIPDWRFTFNASNDSAGRPWPANDPVAVQVGSTYLDVLNQLATSLVDYAAAPSGKTLNLWVKDRGTGRSVDSPWVEGENLVNQTTSTSLR